jgi:hypothetical protein
MNLSLKLGLLGHLQINLCTRLMAHKFYGNHPVEFVVNLSSCSFQVAVIDKHIEVVEFLSLAIVTASAFYTSLLAP